MGRAHDSELLGVAMDDLYMLEKAAQLQVLASGLGPLTPIRGETIERTRSQFVGDGMVEWGRMHWAGWWSAQPDVRDWLAPLSSALRRPATRRRSARRAPTSRPD